jgi:hypothetical protein
MKIWQFVVFIIGFALPASAGGNPIEKKNGIVNIPSNHTVDETCLRTELSSFVDNESSSQGRRADCRTGSRLQKIQPVSRP